MKAFNYSFPYVRFCVIGFMLLFCKEISTAQTLRFNEVSGDSGNNDATNDGIIELINTSTDPFDASCYVITNGEWVVVLPPGTNIPAGEVFLIACSEGQNSGTNPNPFPESGLACATCDFPGLPIDFDVCNPANADYVDWAATGFTIDNQGDDDGDQIVLFAANGSVEQAVKWGGGATAPTDNTAVQTGAYTLGTPGTGGAGISSAQLPKALQTGGTCATVVSYTMPEITDVVYEDLTGAPNPGGKALNNSVLQGCNSSFIYNSTTNSWSKTDHPNPGLPNDALAYQFNFSAPTMQCAGATEEVTVTLEVYNWQAVTPGVINAKGGVGSFVSFDAGASTIPWSTYNRDNVTGITTMTYTFTPSSNQTLSLVWDDDKSSRFASTPTGSSSATAVVNNSTPSDCYVASQVPVAVIQNLSVSELDISCPTDFPAGIINLGSLTSGGLNNTFELFDNGVSQGSNSTGIFSLTTDLNAPITVLVKDGSNCSNPITVQIDNNCRQAPVCPTNVAADVSCTNLNESFCPGEEIQLSLTGTNLPNGGSIEWVLLENANDDPYTSGTVIATQAITSLTSTTASVYISNYTPNPTGTDCAAGVEETIVLTNPGTAIIDISGFVIIGNSGGTPMYTVPAGTSIAPGGTYSFNSCPNPGNSSQTFLANSSFPRTIQLQVNGDIVQTVSYNAAANGTTYTVDNPNLSYQIPTNEIVLNPTCANYVIPADACNTTLHIRPRMLPLDASCENPTIPALSYDVVCPTAVLSGGGTICAPGSGTATIQITNGGDGNMVTGNITNGTDDFNFTGMTDADGTATIDITGINVSGDYMIEIINIDNSCPVTTSGTITFEINPAPSVSVSGTTDICAGLISSLPLTINTGTLPFTINYTIDAGAPQTVEVLSDQLNMPTTGLSAGNHTIVLTGVTDNNGCNGTANGSATVNVLELPDPMPVGIVKSECYSGTGTIDLEFSSETLPPSVTIDWYDGATGGNLLQMGALSYVQSVIPTGPYPQRFTVYAQTRNTSTNCINPERTPVDIDIYLQPNLTDVNTQINTCPSTTIDLTALTISDNHNTPGTLSYHITQDGANTDNATDLLNDATAVGAGMYYIRKQLTDYADCYDVIAVQVDIQTCCANPTIDTQPQSSTFCERAPAAFTVNATGTGNLSYQWQEDSGNGFTDLNNNAIYSGVTTTTLMISNINGLNNRQYRVVINNDNNTSDNPADDCSTISDTAVLTVATKPNITAATDTPGICKESSANLNFSPTDDLSILGWFRADAANDCIPTGIVLSMESTYSVSPDTTTTYVVIVENSDQCRDTACITISVIELNAGTINGNQTICMTKDPLPFTATPATVTAGASIRYQWERSFTNCDNGFTVIANTELYDVAKSELSQTAYFRRRAIAELNGITCEALSNCITIQVLKVNCGAFPWEGNN
ncbi:MAG: lamin tail domain-containing protein [Saprospiraceae bacterium]